MVTKETVDRINELSRKQRSIGLTGAEKEEQAGLRQEYIAAIKGNLKATLENVKVVGPEEYARLVAEGRVHGKDCDCGCKH